MMIYRREREKNEQEEVRVENGGFGSDGRGLRRRRW